MISIMTNLWQRFTTLAGRELIIPGDFLVAKTQLSLTNRPTLGLCTPCCAVKSCTLMNDCDLLAEFSDFYLPFSHLTLSVRGIPSNYRWRTARRQIGRICDFYLPFSHLTPSTRESPRIIGYLFGMRKLEWLGYSLVKVVWWSTQSFGHNTSTWQTHRQPRRHSKQHKSWSTRSCSKAVLYVFQKGYH